MIEVNLEIKSESGIIEKTIEYPTSYETLTYKQYITINKILLEDIENKLKDKKILSFLLNITMEEVGCLFQNVYNQLIEYLNFLTEEIPISEPIRYLKLNGQSYFMRDEHSLTVNEQEFIDNIQNEHGMFEAMPYIIGLMFTLKGEEDKLITQEQLDKMAGFVQDVSVAQIYNVFFSSGNMPQMSSSNIVTYLKNQLEEITSKALEMT